MALALQSYGQQHIILLPRAAGPLSATAAWHYAAAVLVPGAAAAWRYAAVVLVPGAAATLHRRSL